MLQVDATGRETPGMTLRRSAPPKTTQPRRLAPGEVV
jgi:hypothetical protein